MQDSNDLFMDPANPEVRKYVQDIMLELATKYPDLDGLQYDYIRYPFHDPNVGLNANSWKSFQKEFPAYKELSRPADPEKFEAQMLTDWNKWKAGQIDSFVKDTSEKLQHLNPKIDISAAVYPTDLNDNLRQHWDGWLKNGWVTTLNPMTYVPHDASSKDAVLTADNASKLKSDIVKIEKAADGHGTILPGIEVARVNPEGMLKEQQIVSKMGLPGETLFAASVLTDTRMKQFEMEDTDNDFNSFSNIIHAAWSKGDSSTHEQRQNFAKDADSIGRKLDDLSATSSTNEIKPVLAQVNELERGITKFLSQNPTERNQWTELFLKNLNKAQESLLAAANSVEFAAWKPKATP
jgi:hypothetical protein